VFEIVMVPENSSLNDHISFIHDRETRVDPWREKNKKKNGLNVPTCNIIVPLFHRVLESVHFNPSHVFFFFISHICSWWRFFGAEMTLVEVQVTMGSYSV
jgi:hypothetical protein